MPSTHEMFLFQRNRQEDPQEIYTGKYETKLINKEVIRQNQREIPEDSQQ